MKRKILLLLLLALLVNFPAFGTNAVFTASTRVNGSQFVTSDWVAPGKPTGLTIYKNHTPSERVLLGCGGVTDTTKITIEWQENPETDIDYYWLGTKFNPRHKQVFHPNHQYLANMTPGNNPYYYTVIAVDKAGNESEISDQCDLFLDTGSDSEENGGGSGSGNGSENGGGTVSSPPRTTLTIDNGLVFDEKVENGGFETGGSISDWQETGSTARLAADFEAAPLDGGFMARIGDTGDYGNALEDNSLAQTISYGTKNLSFYYNFYTYDYAFDQPGFSLGINGQTVWDIFASDLYFNIDGDLSYYEDFPDYSNWQKTYVDLTQFGNVPLETTFNSGNTGDEELQSWVYLDNMSTTEVVASKDTQFHLLTEEGAKIYYQVQIGGLPYDDSAWQFLGIKQADFDLKDAAYSSGDYAIYYRSVKGDMEESPNIVKVHLDKEKPSAINDLEVSGISTSSAMLLWTVAPDFFGEEEVRPASYDIRYWLKPESTSCLVSAWETATKVQKPPMPRFPYEVQDFEIGSLQKNTAYCFGIKTCDTALNCSSISKGKVITEENGGEEEEIVPGATLVRDEIPEQGHGNVVINELMWMGSSKSGKDEWVELRNMTDQNINLAEWQIVKKKSDGTEECMYTFKHDPINPLLPPILPANSYVVVSEFNSNSSKSALAINCPSSTCFVVGDGDNDDKEPLLSTFTLYNNRLQLKLYDGFWTDPKVNLVDTADDWKGAPAAGEHDASADIYYSMERNNENPGDGTDKTNWHTCEANYTLLAGYWDEEFMEKGTPGAQNLSQLDLVKIEFLLSEDRKSVGFKISDIAEWETLTYEITYNSDQGPQGILGMVEVEGQEVITRDNLKLGTCSSDNNVCTYNTGVIDLKLKIILKTGEKSKEFITIPVS
ncbi:MAG TPA: lamin tail domain-containing protein [Candidatus Bathyarchaeia archaeon]|nr:lamin tail domain-containing protein [Candidatus Bathyarchaeia archaeon]